MPTCQDKWAIAHLSIKICYTADIICGQFGISCEKDLIEQRFGARFEAEFFTPRYNVALSQSLPVILNQEPKAIKFVAWGLRPVWMTKVTKREGIINVRAETLRERPI
jgi:putative SOS response-associated peptidase YedK